MALERFGDNGLREFEETFIIVRPRPSRIVSPLLRVARCAQCSKKLAEHVNADARLFCGRCREVVSVQGSVEGSV